ncbi:MAG: SGNH/GDSL hydrolase family protein [Phycisphaerae bacterium]|nr:SGNH/GDSL hydrolase family protein [Phycisphaerae bacterium]
MKRRKHTSLTPQSAARMAKVLLGLFTFYIVLAAAMLIVVWNLPRSVVPLTPVRRGLVVEAMVVHGAMLLVAAFATLVVHRRPRMPLWFPKITTAVVFLGVVVSADLIVGIVFPPPRPLSEKTIFQLHPTRGWAHRPNSVARLSGSLVRTDERGLRVEKEARPEEMDGKTRILFVGDSVTLGYYHRARDAYGWQTVARLKERHPRAKLLAMNGGICGYDMRQKYLWFEHEGLAIDPDLVVLQFCLNDVTARYDPAFEMNQNRHLEIAQSVRPTSRSGFHRAIIAVATRLRFGTDAQAAAEKIEHFAYQQALTDSPPQHVKHAWQDVLGQLTLFIERCREADVPMMLVCFPVRLQLERPDASADPQEALSEFAASHSVLCLTLLSAYRQEGGTGSDAVRALFVDGTHPTVLGHRIAADALASFLEESGLLADVLEPGGSS